MRRTTYFSIYFAWVVSCIALLGSLYFSEIRSHLACNLCWYQRICVYPLALILGIGAYRGFFGIVVYTLPLSLIGLVLAVYQLLIQYLPEWQPIAFCGAGPSCSEPIDIGFGFITIPLLSVLAFGIINFFLILASTHKSNSIP